MKTILAPVDFSDVSINALSFAAELAARAYARLIILHIQQDEDDGTTKDKLDVLQSELKGTLGSALRCRSLVGYGRFIATLEKIITSIQPDLLVMGTKGASGLKKLFIGSNTVNVIARTRIPLFVIPEAAKFEAFYNTGKNRVVLASDLETVENEYALNVLKQIALLIIQPKLNILSVREKDTWLPDEKRAERNFLLSYFEPWIESERVTVFSNNVMSGINFYLKKNEDTGLVAMIARNSEQLFQKHYTREMASHTRLPLLVMHDA